ncbi:hypothetical protein Patl1_02548 [Pistacia atlantica]|uniref:Uncharacterized protein n=1 Tax=Pistacia atlantica TaxID=434234 RepID=A0ACC1C4W1_9ROSI|nr:hypothetical protein Patl1_02548 [Pistacia atlantica]
MNTSLPALNSMKPHRTNVLLNLATSIRASQTTKPNQNVQNFIDARLVKTGFDLSTCRSNFLVESLVKRGELSEARKMFDQMPNRNTVSTNMIISGYVKSGNLASARELFDGMVERTSVSWTILIGAYSRRNHFREAFRLFVDMRRGGFDPDYVTFATLLSGCNDLDTANEVIQVHANIVKFGYNSALVVCNSLVDSYCKIRRLDLACRIFKEMPEKDSISFNALITGHAKVGLNKKAIRLFIEMQHLGYKPSDFTFAAALSAGIGFGDIALGQLIHAFVVKSNFVGNVFVGNALLDFYSKHDSVVEARKLFDEMPEVDGISYNVIITCYAWSGLHKESLKLFRELHFTRFDRRQFPFPTLLSIVANMVELEIGRQVHTQTIVTTANSEVQVGNSLVDMYAKCGKFEEARKIFATLSHKSGVPWTAMISAS